MCKCWFLSGWRRMSTGTVRWRRTVTTEDQYDHDGDHQQYMDHEGHVVREQHAAFQHGQYTCLHFPVNSVPSSKDKKKGKQIEWYPTDEN
ncbi:hypothetical protein BaRGS_00034772 [Batillaria attramentaria]|uniref:Uncharacterized protein n=1 Tax=Batillaria attramentaria TaxID=370345 RepID=A0ABD0JGS8_9CAEN